MTGFSGAVDLSALGQQTNDGTFLCTVPNGCGYTLRVREGGTHDTLEDCVGTAVGYAETVMQTALTLQEEVQNSAVLSDEIVRLRGQVDTLIGANRRFQADLSEKEKALVKLRTVKVQEDSNGQERAA